MRNSFGARSETQTNRQRTRPHETHREQVSVAGKEHTVNEQVETGFFQTIDNSDNPNR